MVQAMPKKDEIDDALNKFCETVEKKKDDPEFQKKMEELKKSVYDYQHSQLTRRESQCVYLMFNGHCAKEIGRSLQISYLTVEKHVENIK